MEVNHPRKKDHHQRREIQRVLVMKVIKKKHQGVDQKRVEMLKKDLRKKKLLRVKKRLAKVRAIQSLEVVPNQGQKNLRVEAVVDQGPKAKVIRKGAEAKIQDGGADLVMIEKTARDAMTQGQRDTEVRKKTKVEEEDMVVENEEKREMEVEEEENVVVVEVEVEVGDVIEEEEVVEEIEVMIVEEEEEEEEEIMTKVGEEVADHEAIEIEGEVEVEGEIEEEKEDGDNT